MGRMNKCLTYRRICIFQMDVSVIMINKTKMSYLFRDPDPHGLGPSLASPKFHPSSGIKVPNTSQ